MEKLKKSILFLLIIIIIGIISGIIFSNVLNSNDEKLVVLKITNYFNNLKNDIPIDYFSNLISSLKNNFIYLIIIWLLGLSIIGLILNNFILFFKSFILGFSIGSIINIYLYSGIVLSLIYVFPALIINIFIYGVLTYYANKFSLKLFNLLFLKKEIKFSLTVKRYLRLLFICLIILFISSLFETFLTPLIIRLSSFLIR